MEAIKLKAILSVLCGCIISILGGADKLLYALFVLSIIDLMTGFSAAVITGTPSSHKAWHGVLKKTLMFVAVAVGVIIDMVFGMGFEGIVAIHPAIKAFFASLGFSLNVRNVILVYAILTEVVSNFENFAKCGVRLPRWLFMALRKLSGIMAAEEEKKEG